MAQVSRYLDRVGAPAGSRKHGLLMVAFCRQSCFPAIDPMTRNSRESRVRLLLPPVPHDRVWAHDDGGWISKEISMCSQRVR